MRSEPGGTTVVLSPPPTPNGPLHLGHLAGPYVAADVAVRAARRRGERVLAVCGLDDHQNYVLARARAEGRDVEELRKQYAEEIREVFARIRVAHDVFVEPATDSGYRNAVVAFLDELCAAGGIDVTDHEVPACGDCGVVLHHAYVSGTCPTCGETAGGGTCEGCGDPTPADRLIAPRCTRCGGANRRGVTVRGPVLRMADHRETLLRIWATAVLPPRVRAMLGRLLDRGLPTVPLAYPTDWGIETPGFAGLRLDVWAEMALGYLRTIGGALSPDARDLRSHVAAWREVAGVWTFLGIDNAFYYAAMFPALFAAAGVPAGAIAGLVVNEFYTLNGAKFSTSRGHAIWAHEFLEDEDPAMVRAFLCWDRPDFHPADFTLERYRRMTAEWSGPPRRAGKDPADRARAERALELPSFDLALAARCLLPSADPEDALLGVLMGRGDRR